MDAGISSGGEILILGYTLIHILILILSSFSWDFLAPTNVDGCASAGIPSILGLKICEKLIATGS